MENKKGRERKKVLVAAFNNNRYFEYLLFLEIVPEAEKTEKPTGVQYSMQRLVNQAQCLMFGQ